MHSPFIFEFITKVLNDKHEYPAYATAEEVRKRMLNDHTAITVEDLGAGSVVSKNRERKISSIADSAAKPAKFGQLLHRIAKFYQPQTIIELGTSLGITSSYLATAGNHTLYTLEGSTAIADVAANNFASAGLKNIEQVLGNFDDTLQLVIDKTKKVDLAFIDGNHRYEPTLRYFTQLLHATHNDSILIFDDIHWSEEMERAWKEISGHQKVRASVDLFYVGIVFFRNEFREKQSFSIRF